MPESLDALSALLWSALKEANERAPADLRSHSEALLLGTRNYRSPGGRTGLGLVSFQFCYLLVLTSSANLNLSELLHGRESGTPNGLKTWNWQAALFGESGEKTALHAALIGRSYLVISDTLVDFQRVSQRLEHPDPVSGVPPILRFLPEWETVSRQTYWAYRRYQRPANQDPIAAGLEGIPGDARFLVLFPDLAKSAVILHLISASPPIQPRRIPPPPPPGSRPATSLPNQPPPGHSAFPDFRSINPGVWEAVTPLSGDEQTIEHFFVILGMFGFGAYL